MRSEPPVRSAGSPPSAVPRVGVRRRLGLGALILLGGCGTIQYAPEPVDLTTVLRELRSQDEADPRGGPDQSGATAGLTMEQAAAFAVARNSQLVALRAEIGVSRARLVEAGLLPDPSFGWDAMDVLTDQWLNGDVEKADWVGGFGLSWRVPRPGEISAQEAIAQAELGQTEWAVVRSEWMLAQDVATAWIELASVRSRLEATRDLLALGRRTASVLERARAASAATGIEANLAALDVADLELDGLGLEDEEIQARQRLNALLGLAPDAEYSLASWTAIVGEELPEPPEPHAIVDAAVKQRPDLAELQQRYEGAEAELRLEVARQYPELSIGTGIEITLPLLSRWNRPAIDRAFAMREAVRRALEAEVARVRADIHASIAAYRRARRQSDYLTANVEPRLAESQRLTAAGLDARELGALEVLLTQRQISNARMRALSARFEAASSWVRVLAASGRLFGSDGRQMPDAQDAEGSE